MGQSQGKYVYFIFQQKKKVITWLVYVSWASFCCLGESFCSRQDGAASEILLCSSLLYLYLVSSFLRLWILSSLAFVSCRLLCVSGIVFLGLCLLSLVSCLFISGSSLVCQSQDYLRSAGQSGCIEGCAASNSGRSLIEEILCFVPKRKYHTYEYIYKHRSILGNSFYLKFELSLAMRGKAVISTEKRWAL